MAVADIKGEPLQPPRGRDGEYENIAYRLCNELGELSVFSGNEGSGLLCGVLEPPTQIGRGGDNEEDMGFMCQ